MRICLPSCSLSLSHQDLCQGMEENAEVKDMVNRFVAGMADDHNTSDLAERCRELLLMRSCEPDKVMQLRADWLNVGLPAPAKQALDDREASTATAAAADGSTQQ